MKDKNFDNMLKAYFSKKIGLPERGSDCPSPEALAQYALGAPSAAELYDIGAHIERCKSCGEVIDSAFLYSVYGSNVKLENVPAKMKEAAKLLNPTYRSRGSKPVALIRKNIWFVLCVTSFIVSFFVPRHFLQFLILAVIFGFKWVFDKETTRTLIMVYNAWKKHDKESSRDIEELFKNRV